MYLDELKQKSDFVQEEYTRLAKKINSSISQLWYVHKSLTNEEILVIEYDTGYKKMIDITCDSLRAIVFDSITKL